MGARSQKVWTILPESILLQGSYGKTMADVSCPGMTVFPFPPNPTGSEVGDSEKGVQNMRTQVQRK